MVVIASALTRAYLHTATCKYFQIKPNPLLKKHTFNVIFSF